MQNRAFLGLVLIVCSIYSCDKVDNPYIKKQGNASIPVTPPTRVDSTRATAQDDSLRKILIEDYTGHECTNCPAASAQVDGLLSTDTYKKQGILLAVNASVLADSNTIFPGAPDGAFKNYYRTPDGDAWFNMFIGIAVPGIMVNRVYCGNPPVAGGDQDLNYNGINIYTPYDSLAQLGQAAMIHIVDSMYAPPANTVSMTITSKILAPQAGNKYYLVVMLVEDSIYDYQDSVTIMRPYYLHRMFMRTAINGGGNGSGDSLVNNNTLQAKHYVFTSSNFAYNNSPITLPPQVPPSSWNMAHMFVVAFIYQTTSAAKGNYLILQAQRLHL